MANKSTNFLKNQNRDFNNVLDSMQNYSSIQKLESTGAHTILADTNLLVMTVDGAMTPTMPAALAGRRFKAIWQVEQATNDRVFTAAGSDTFAGNIFTSVAGDSAGDGDVVAIANTTVTITCVDDVNIGSYLDFFCASDGLWLVTGHLVLDDVANVPTLA